MGGTTISSADLQSADEAIEKLSERIIECKQLLQALEAKIKFVKTNKVLLDEVIKTKLIVFAL